MEMASLPLGRGLDLGDRTVQEKDDAAVSAALDAVIAVAESPVELRCVVIPRVDADLDDGRSPWRGRDQRLGRPHHRGADAEALKGWKDAEGPELDDAFGGRSLGRAADGLPVRQRQKEDDIGAVFGHCLSHVVGLDCLFAVPLKTIEIAVAERPNLDRE